jgi:hypothetical protein
MTTATNELLNKEKEKVAVNMQATQMRDQLQALQIQIQQQVEEKRKDLAKDAELVQKTSQLEAQLEGKLLEVKSKEEAVCTSEKDLETKKTGAITGIA